MSDLATLRIALFAAEMAAASGLIMAAAGLAAGHGAASRRHLIWSAAFGALLLLPLLTAVVPGAITWTVPAPVTVSQMPVETIAADEVPQAVPAVATTAPQAAPAHVVQIGTEDVVDAALVIWLGGALLIALRGAVAFAALRFMLRNSVDAPFEPEELPALASGRRYRLRVSKGEHGPITWGIFRPVVLLPRQSLFWPCERLQAVMRHELAHVERRDCLTQAISMLACALYWPNPLVWLGLRAQRRAAEMAADDAVLVSGMAASDYAGELLHVAAEFRARPLSPALFMAAPSSLSARVQSVLAETQQRTGVTAMDVLKMAGVALLAASALVVARPSLAQDMPPPPAAAATADAPPAPPALPADAAVPPVPPTPPDAALPAPPTPPPPPAIPADRGTKIVRITETRDAKGHRHRQVRVQYTGEVPDVNVEMARVKPEMDRAMAEIKAHEVEIRRIQNDLQPRINAEVVKALAEARAQVARIDDAKIRAKVEAALARAEKKLKDAPVVVDDEGPDTMDVKGDVQGDSDDNSGDDK